MLTLSCEGPNAQQVPARADAGPPRIAALDGLRGVAILVVIAKHYGVYHWPAAAGSFVGDFVGRVFPELYAPDLFLVLTGYLLGGRLLATLDSPRYFSSFYLRRVCRTFPLYYLLLVCFSASVLGRDLIAPWLWLDLDWPFGTPWSLAAYAAFLQSFWIAVEGSLGPHWLAITWTLAVQEQFYLVLPGVMRLARGFAPLPRAFSPEGRGEIEDSPHPQPLSPDGRGENAPTPHPNPPPQGGREKEFPPPQGGREKEFPPPQGGRELWLGAALVGLFLMGPVGRLLVVQTVPAGEWYGYAFLLCCRSDPLAIGVLAAWLLQAEPARKRLVQRRWLLGPVAAVLFVGFALGTYAGYTWPVPAVFVLGDTYRALMYLTFVLIAAYAPDGLVGTMLRRPLLCELGRISYGLFLFHEMVRDLFFRAVFGMPPQLDDWETWLATGEAFLLTVFVAELCWHTVEQPLIAWSKAK